MTATGSTRRRLAGVVLALALPLAAPADTAYITDRIQVGLHEEDTLNSAVTALLPSGTPLEVIERDGQIAKVRSEAGDEGWVDAAYLSDDAPAAARLAAASEDVARMREDTAAARREAAALAERLADAGGEMAALRAELEAAREARRALETALAEETAARLEVEAALERAEEGAGDAAALSKALHDVQRLAEESGRLKQELAELEANKAMVAENAASGDAPAPAPAPAGDEWTRAAPGPGADVIGADLLGFLTWQPWQWLLLASALALAFGAGGYVVDLGVRRRHGGYRI